MKTSKFFALGIIFLALSSFRMEGVEVKGAQIDNRDDSNYVVIGAFSIQQNAVNFTSKASQLNMDAKYEMNQNRHLYYVYVLTTQDKQQAIDEALRLRKDSPYSDTWVFHGNFGSETIASNGSDINPATTENIAEVKTNDPFVSTPTNIEKTVAVGAASGASLVKAAVNDSNKVVEESPEVEITGKAYFFKIFRSDDQVEVEGDVNVIDAERSRKIGTFAGNKRVGISDPKNKDGNVSFVCEIFGYRKVQRDVNFNNPVGDGISVDESKTTVIPFELVRLQKGDIAVMYNVFFFKDAAIMRPESRFEVTSLLTMLQENTKYKIKIHGHTNGGAHGRIISLEEGNTDYFSLNNTKDGLGSAKELSEQRAEVVKEFLVTNGIDESRMEIKAWGGKRPLYDKHSPQAQSNVRVEIEILEN
ncbi:MAG TPA: OmpA family protein [Cyclobacteriaceae bacterium]|nr:OmpA family protein [Cyclobacteriaceae bacterium]